MGQALQSEIPALVAIDDKTVRRSRNSDIPPIHVLSAWVSDQNLVMGQVKTDMKANEITAIQELLEMLTLKMPSFQLTPRDAKGKLPAR